MPAVAIRGPLPVDAARGVHECGQVARGFSATAARHTVINGRSPARACFRKIPPW